MGYTSRRERCLPVTNEKVKVKEERCKQKPSLVFKLRQSSAYHIGQICCSSVYRHSQQQYVNWRGKMVRPSDFPTEGNLPQGDTRLRLAHDHQGRSQAGRADGRRTR